MPNFIMTFRQGARRVATATLALAMLTFFKPGCTTENTSMKNEPRGDSTFIYQTGPTQKEMPAAADSSKQKKEDIIKTTPKKINEVKMLEDAIKKMEEKGDTTSFMYKRYQKLLGDAKNGIIIGPQLDNTQQTQNDIKEMETLLEKLRAKGDSTSSLYQTIQNRLDLTKKGIKFNPRQ